jgi:ornithine carbamoyltransferase
MRHLLTLLDLSKDEINELLRLAVSLKTQFVQGIRKPVLPGRVLGLLFSKPSLRTRVSFEAAMTHLGGTSLYLGQDVGWGKREPASDFGRVLSQYTDAIVCRTFAHASIEELARYCDCPVINGLTDMAHPCQALADLLTLQEEHGSLTGLSMTFVGDGNNVSRSLAIACKLLGVRFTLAAPSGYEFDQSFLKTVESLEGDGEVRNIANPVDAVKGTNAVYTDVWSSMGQEKEQKKREKQFASHQVNAELMAHAPDAIFLHCLPAKRGQEVTSDVIDGPKSRIVEQAANRMHAQKAVLAWLLTDR